MCLQWVAQASGELCLDSSSPLLRFASVLQAASIRTCPKQAVVPLAHCSNHCKRIQVRKITCWDSCVRCAKQKLLVLTPCTVSQQSARISHGSVACATDLSQKRSQAISLQQ